MTTPIRAFALTVPGLGGLLAAELDGMPGVRTHGTGFDGRSDVVLLTASHLATPLTSHLAEDVFIEAGRAETGRAAQVSTRLWSHHADRAIATRGRFLGPLRTRATFRVVVRVRLEREFRRTELRRHLTGTIARRQPRWRLGDPSEVEIWAIEYQPGRLIAGLRATGRSMRQHGGREIERHGALRPAVAAAMVQLAGPASLLLDPFCGTGTILTEAHAHGWRAIGIDIDRQATAAARRNAPRARVARADSYHLPFRDASIPAIVSNPPFGRQYQLRSHDWLTESVRVAAERVVLLAPALPVHPQLRFVARVPIRLLGTATTIWAYHRP